MFSRNGMSVATALLLLLLAGCASTTNHAPRVLFETQHGSIVVELYPNKAPITTANFLRYVDSAAYREATFYRVTRAENDASISVIQGGLWQPWQQDMIKNYEAPFPSIPHETTQSTGLQHTDGVISMGRLAVGTANSEFFINVGDNPDLDFGGTRHPDGQGFAAFGRVIEGMDVVRAIHAMPTNDGQGFMSQVLSTPIVITDSRSCDCAASMSFLAPR